MIAVSAPVVIPLRLDVEELPLLERPSEVYKIVGIKSGTTFRKVPVILEQDLQDNGMIMWVTPLITYDSLYMTKYPARPLSEPRILFAHVRIIECPAVIKTPFGYEKLTVLAAQGFDITVNQAYELAREMERQRDVSRLAN